MTDRKQALTDLLAKVEAGEFLDKWKDWNCAGLALNSYGLARSGYAWEAFNGSLDAAIALHDAVLPGWKWSVSSNSASVFLMDHPHSGNIQDGKADTPARAWLIAILRALIAQEEERERWLTSCSSV